MKDLNDLSNSNYLDESEKYSNAGGFLGDIEKALADAEKNVRQTSRDVGKNIEGTSRDIGKNIEQTTKEIGQNVERTTNEILQNKDLKNVLKAVFLTYNPAVLIPRTSALLAFRVNLFGISSRLYPAFLSDSELIKFNFDLENAKRVKKIWEDVANFWEDKLGGDRKALKEAISGSWNKPIFKTVKSQERRRSTASFDGIYEEEYSYAADPYSGAAIAGYITAGLGVVSFIVSLLDKYGAKENPHQGGTQEAKNYDNQLQGAGSPPPVNQEELDRIAAAAKSDRDKGLGLDDSGLDAKQLEETGIFSRKSGKILGMPKGIVIGVGIALVLLGGFFIYKKYKK